VEGNNKESFEFVASKTTSLSSSFLPNLVTDTEAFSDTYKPSSSLHNISNRLQLTALALVDGPKVQTENKSRYHQRIPEQSLQLGHVLCLAYQ
jgi:hypothetical protein